MKKISISLIFISIILFVTSCGLGNQVISSHVDFGKTDYKKITSSNNQLGFDLLSHVNEHSNGNIFISPTSLFMALSMIYNGADGETKNEIAKVLQIEGLDETDLNKANASLLSKLHSNSKQIQLNISNSIWLNENFHFQANFAQNNREYFNANIEAIDITDSKSVKMMNDWVKKSTKNKIDKIIEAPLSTDTVAILINAIYFKGSWKDEFSKKLTEKRAFYLENKSPKNVPFMKLNKKMLYIDNEYFQAVSLPYGDGEMSMKVFLPKENSSLNEFKNLLIDDNWEDWLSQFQKKEGIILLPKFKMEYEIVLNDILKQLGMTTAFNKGANFSKIIEGNDLLWISLVKQKTFIDVNEEGTEAAAATSVVMTTESSSMDQPFYMEVNRPFFFTITDEATGIILFMGAIAEPEVESGINT